MSNLYGQYDLGVETGRGQGNHISLYSDDEYTTDLVVKEVFGELVQKDRLKGITRKYAIVNVHYLMVEERSLVAKSVYWIDLGYLSDKPKRRLIVKWKWLAAATALALSTAATYLSIPFLEFPYRVPILAGLLAGTALSAFYCVYVFIHNSRYRQIYFSRTGNVPFVELMPGNPDSKRYRQFIDTIQEHMLLARRKEPDRSKALARELREHRRLHDAGIINDRQYTRAKMIILKSYS